MTSGVLQTIVEGADLSLSFPYMCCVSIRQVRQTELLKPISLLPHNYSV